MPFCKLSTPKKTPHALSLSHPLNKHQLRIPTHEILHIIKNTRKIGKLSRDYMILHAVVLPVSGPKWPTTFRPLLLGGSAHANLKFSWCSW